MTGGGRHTEPVDVHLVALRDGAAGPEVLLSPPPPARCATSSAPF
jgi:hypothetical protein